ncbi:DUF6220 domain-containing protein [Glycomyces buryatensis]|uniref:Uncharacterized protein n=1 Tax=Glycomyces buryatensis TaxID=2570927 RepID=A0A4S8QET1_9ACTN|nr:DUF6220 domain-containing protein [Glycomyces buryatensis]THV41612.1 hypothetical protein FAB82_10955 [Glycomyces buryatensis]
MLKFLRIWMGVLLALIVVQFFLAGYGAVGTGALADNYAMHRMTGTLISVFALLGLVFAALARSGGKLVGMAAIILGLVLLQPVIAMISIEGTMAGQIIFGFHVVNAVAIPHVVVGVMTAAGKAKAAKDSGDSKGGVTDTPEPVPAG